MNRKKTLTFAAVSAAFAAISGAALADVKPPDSGTWTIVSTIVSPHATYKSTDQFTFKGKRFRLETSDPSNYYSFDLIDDGQSYYQYDPIQKAALRQTSTTAPPAPLDTLKQETAEKLNGATKTDSSTAEGFACDVYSAEPLGQGTSVTLYLSKDPRFPYIVKSVLVIPQEGITRTNEITDVQLDLPVGDNEFTLPQNTKIVTAPAPSADNSTPSAPTQ
jgi:hypothetical protein